MTGGSAAATQRGRSRISRSAEVCQPRSRWIGLAVSATIGLTVRLAGSPHGLSPAGQKVLAVTAVTVGLWIFGVMGNGITSVLTMALLALSGVRPALVFSGFSNPSFWVLFAVLFYGFAMRQTGLAQRIAFHILDLFPTTYGGILFAFFTIGTVLALAIPSMTVRTAIMAPIAWELVRTLDLITHKRASALIMLTTIEMAVIPGCALLYGSLFGPVIDAMFQSKHIPLTWLGYGQVMAFPVLLFCLLIILVNQRVMRPEVPLNPHPNFARERLAALGPFKSTEAITAGIAIASVVFWATDRIHHLPAFIAGMIALPLFALAGIVRDDSIGTAVSWNLLLFLGAAFGLTNVIDEYKIADWLAGSFLPVVRHLTFSPIALLIAAAVVMLLVRFLDPTGFIAIPVVFLPMVDMMRDAGVPPLVLTAAILLASSPFWLTYENIWMAMAEAIAEGHVFTWRERTILASIYGFLAIATLVLAVGYWKLLGLL
jgi:anion transporter